MDLQMVNELSFYSIRQLGLGRQSEIGNVHPIKLGPTDPPELSSAH